MDFGIFFVRIEVKLLFNLNLYSNGHLGISFEQWGFAKNKSQQAVKPSRVVLDR